MPERDAVANTDYNSVLRDLQSSFRNQYKYKILGKTDSFFQYTAKMIENDQTKLSLFKSRRTAEQTQLAQIQNNAALSENEKLQQSAGIKVGYLKDAYRTIKSATYDDSIKTTNLKYSVSYFLKELEQGVKDYISSRGDGALTADDQKFFSDALQIVDNMERLVSKLRIKVRSEGIIFDNNTYQSSKRIDSLRALITSAQAGGTSAATDTASTDAASDTSGGVDIIV